MEIGLVYSGKDPRHAQTRAFLKQFVKERGILANIVESDQPVATPILTIDGCTVLESGLKALKAMTPSMETTSTKRFPSKEDIARAIEKSIWCL